jgi:cell division septation protein DedD
MAKPKPIKVCLTNAGKDTETPWAEDLGPAPGRKGSRRVRLINVPFMHAKPTWGDVIVVSPVDDGLPTWDRAGTPWAQIGARIAEDCGRWAMIVDYVPHPDSKDAFNALARACAEHDVVCEGAWDARDGDPGRVYLAVSGALTDDELMTRLRAAELPCELIQIHPEPLARPKPRAVAKRVTARTPSRAASTTSRAATKSPTKPPPKPAPKPATKPPPMAKPVTKPTTKPTAKKPASKTKRRT